MGGDKKPGQGFTMYGPQCPASANTDMSIGVINVVQELSLNLTDGEIETDKNLSIVPTVNPECGIELESIVSTLNISQLGHSLKTKENNTPLSNVYSSFLF